ncbi:MAG: methyltransferase domain-containing protein [Magnetococcales bacterium]|nr:methyltransferase domain-containing protein [Magnetococcales bacterium]
MDNPIIDALIQVHKEVPRKGPGSDRLTRALLERFAPRLPDTPAMADLGCGNGHSAFLLAELLGGSVTAVDFSPPFIEELKTRARTDPHGANITPVVGDMLTPPVPDNGFDLIWSEGAAYAVGTRTALEAWQPLLAEQGLLIFSDCCWLKPERTAEVVAFWEQNYPGMLSIGDNITQAETLGYDLLACERLPSAAWWQSYYDPMEQRLKMLEEEASHDRVLAGVIAESRREATLFRRHSDQYGYVFYVLRRR